MAASRPYRYGRPTSLGRPAGFGRPHNGFGRPVSVPQTGPAPLPTQGKAVQGVFASTTVTVSAGAATGNRAPAGNTSATSLSNVPTLQISRLGNMTNPSVVVYTNTATDPYTFGGYVTDGSESIKASVPAGSTAPVTAYVSEPVTSGEFYGYTFTTGGGISSGSINLRGWTWSYQGTLAHTQQYFCNHANTTTASAVRYQRIFGAGTAHTTLTPAEVYMDVDCTFYNYGITVLTNARTSDTVFDVLVDGVAAASITVTAGATGDLFSATTSFAVTAGQKIAIRRTNGLGTGSIACAIAMTFVNAVAAQNHAWVETLWGTLGTNGTYYGPIVGVTPASTTYNGTIAYNSCRHGFTGKVIGARVYVNTNGRNADTIVRLLINGVATACSFTIPSAGGTAWYQLSDLDIDFDPEDECVWEMTVAGSSGTVGISNLGLLEQYVSD